MKTTSNKLLVMFFTFLALSLSFYAPYSSANSASVSIAFKDSTVIQKTFKNCEGAEGYAQGRSHSDKVLCSALKCKDDNEAILYEKSCVNGECSLYGDPLTCF